MGVIGVISILTMLRVYLWVVDLQRGRHRSATLNHPLVEHDQFNYDDDDI